MYDGDDQLREVVSATTGERELYWYDHTGARFGAVRFSAAGGFVHSRAWLTDTDMRETYGAGGAFHTVVRVELGAMPIAEVWDGARDDPRFVFNGVLGSLLAILDSDGEPLARFAYGPWGEFLWKEGDELPWHLRRFNGKEYDPFSRLSYYGFRYYDRLSLTWTQADPLYRFAPDLAYSEPRRASLYTFDLNNPVRYVDPGGRNPGLMPNPGTSAKAAGEFLLREISGTPHPQRPKDGWRQAMGGFAIIADVFGAGQVADFAEGVASAAVKAHTPGDKVAVLVFAIVGAPVVAVAHALEMAGVAEASQRNAGGPGQGFKLGSHKSATKWANQMKKRAWTSEQIGEAMAKGKQFKAPNLVSKGNAATRYVHPETGRSVVVDDVTKEVIHVGGDAFKY